MSNPKVVSIKGPQLRADSSKEISDHLIQLINRGHTQIILDFNDVQFIDSSFMGFLIIILKRTTAQKGDVKLCCLQKPLKDVFEMMRLTRLFEIFESPEDALRSFG